MRFGDTGRLALHVASRTRFWSAGSRRSSRSTVCDPSAMRVLIVKPPITRGEPTGLLLAVRLRSASHASASGVAATVPIARNCGMVPSGCLHIMGSRASHVFISFSSSLISLLKPWTSSWPIICALVSRS